MRRSLVEDTLHRHGYRTSKAVKLQQSYRRRANSIIPYSDGLREAGAHSLHASPRLRGRLFYGFVARGGVHGWINLRPLVGITRFFRTSQLLISYVPALHPALEYHSNSKSNPLARSRDLDGINLSSANRSTSLLPPVLRCQSVGWKLRLQTQMTLPPSCFSFVANSKVSHNG